MAFLPGLAISASALTAERLRLDLIAQNLANLETTRTPAGGPYRRKVAVLEPVPLRWASGVGGGVRVTSVRVDPRPFPLRYDPSHPDEGPGGMVAMPNVDPLREMVDMLSALRAYEANAAAFEASKRLAQRTLELGF